MVVISGSGGSRRAGRLLRVSLSHINLPVSLLVSMYHITVWLSKNQPLITHMRENNHPHLRCLADCSLTHSLTQLSLLQQSRPQSQSLHERSMAAKSAQNAPCPAARPHGRLLRCGRHRRSPHRRRPVAGAHRRGRRRALPGQRPSGVPRDERPEDQARRGSLLHGIQADAAVPSTPAAAAWQYRRRRRRRLQLQLQRVIKPYLLLLVILPRRHLRRNCERPSPQHMAPFRSHTSVHRLRAPQSRRYTSSRRTSGHAMGVATPNIIIGIIIFIVIFFVITPEETPSLRRATLPPDEPQRRPHPLRRRPRELRVPAGAGYGGCARAGGRAADC